MKLKVYAIFDSASGVYDGPFKARGHGEIIRMFGDLAVSADHPIGNHPEHFSLYFIGYFDDNKAELEPCERQVLVTGEECVAQSRNIEPGSLKEVGN